jgi:hypothetical protein
MIAARAARIRRSNNGRVGADATVVGPGDYFVGQRIRVSVSSGAGPPMESLIRSVVARSPDRFFDFNGGPAQTRPVPFGLGNRCSIPLSYGTTPLFSTT